MAKIIALTVHSAKHIDAKAKMNLILSFFDVMVMKIAVPNVPSTVKVTKEKTIVCILISLAASSVK